MAASSTSELNHSESGDSSKGRRRRRRLAIIAGAALAEVIPVWRRGYGVGGNVIVRCHEGHLFTTIWVPGASVKSLRLGPRRVQWCPVGHHLSLVTLVRESDLSARQLRAARGHKDVRVP
ncbi:MAG TPA: hypothetical protein VMG37_13145 [Solirubrobacteraceae bacterium]|nr:hypothetical protein [Solirubrobacteraceae bacterium]